MAIISLGTNAILSGNLELTGTLSSSSPISASYFYGDGSQLTNLPISSGSGVSSAEVSGAITGAIADFPTRTEVSGAITGALIPYATSADVSASFAGLSTNNTFTGINSFNNSITGTDAYFSGDLTINGTASIASLQTVNQQSLVVGDKYIVIMSGGLDHVGLDGAGILWGSGSSGSSVDENGAHAYIKYRNEYDKLEIFSGLRISGSLTSSATISSSGGFYGDGSGLTNLPISSGSGVSAAEVSGAITGALVPYATLVGVSASFTTPAQVSSSITSALTTYPTRVEVSGAITSSISNFPTRAEVSGTLTASYWTGARTQSEVSGVLTSSLTNYATLSGVSASFTTKTALSGVLTASYWDIPRTKTEISGVLTSSLTNYVNNTQVSGVLTASYWDIPRTKAEVTGAVTGAINNMYQGAGATYISRSFASYDYVFPQGQAQQSQTANAWYKVMFDGTLGSSSADWQVAPIAALFTGSTSTTTLTVDSMVSGTIGLGMGLSGSGFLLNNNTTEIVSIVSFGTGTGSTGTYTIFPAGNRATTGISARYYSRLLYSGQPHTFLLTGHLSYECHSGLELITTAFAKNGVVISSSQGSAYIPNANPVTNHDFSTMVNLVAGDYIEVYHQIDVANEHWEIWQAHINATQVDGNNVTALILSSSAQQISGAITGALGGLPSKSEVSGAITSSLTNYARKDQTNTFTATQNISGNLNVTGTISGAYFVGDGSQLLNLPGGPGGGVNASQVSGAITSSMTKLMNYINFGPAEGYSGSYFEVGPTNSLFATASIWYLNNTKTFKIYEENYTYNGVKVSSINYKLYDSDGSTILRQATDTITYAGVLVTSISRSIT
jgi:hypothetical protein